MRVTGDRLRLLREEVGLTQEEISRKIGIKRATYAKYETGENPAPGALLIKFADLFSLLTGHVVTTDYLLGRTPLKHMKETYHSENEVRWEADPEIVKKNVIDSPTPPQSKQEKLSHEGYILSASALPDALLRIAETRAVYGLTDEQFLDLSRKAIKKFGVPQAVATEPAAHLKHNIPGTGAFDDDDEGDDNDKKDKH